MLDLANKSCEKILAERPVDTVFNDLVVREMGRMGRHEK